MNKSQIPRWPIQGGSWTLQERVPYCPDGSVPDKTIKLWKVSERDKRPEGYNLKDEEGRLKDLSTVTSLQVRTGALWASRVGWVPALIV